MEEKELLVTLLEKYVFVFPGERRMYFDTICQDNIFLTDNNGRRLRPVALPLQSPGPCTKLDGDYSKYGQK
jgi:hypothetical protein